jgi:hypothetical protein
MNARGATLPYIEYEAEAAHTTAAILDVSRTPGQLANESSGRQAVRLDGAGQYVEFTATAPANSIVVRFAIPDAANGGGVSASLGLYIDGGARQDLALTSKYAWTYGPQDALYGSDNPTDANPHHFFDEVRTLIPAGIAAGSKVRLQRDAQDTAAYYVIDLIDLEAVAPPLAMPANFLSISDYGATPDDASEDGAAIQSCVDAATKAGKGVWIPRGTFRNGAAGQPFRVANVAVRGAGMWYSTVQGINARFDFQAGGNAQFYDFSILGETINRDTTAAAQAENAFNNSAGKGSRLENIWIEHTRNGYWTGAGTDGLVISGCRVRNTFSNAIDFFGGTTNSAITQCHARNTGDDAFAGSSRATGPNPNTNNVIQFNTVQLPWRAKCFALYGGTDNSIENNLCVDTIEDAGILIAQEFATYAFAGTTKVEHNTLLRGGGLMTATKHGATEFSAIDSAMAGFLANDNTIESSTYAGIRLAGPNAISNLTLSAIAIDRPGTYGVEVTGNAKGKGEADGVVVSNAPQGGLQDQSGGAWTFTKGGGDSGW